MWLINVCTRRLEEFVGVDVPRYAILSHTWVRGQEVTFSEMRNLRAVEPAARLKAGWIKIEKTCSWAACDGLQYAWVDTCCIDKSSSAELSEAINSMFRWYKRAELCYVFLDDLDGFSRKWAEGEDMDDLQASMKHCRWFTRSWTLQELIAPLHIKFFNKDWMFCFTKAVASKPLSTITGIGVDVLNHVKDLSTVSVAQKMSWAATREATRKEDVAYSLLGIFDINMPMLYGEEEKAFFRLQSEIISSCPDTTIFAWVRPRGQSEQTSKDPRSMHHGVMASSPAFFQLCAKAASLAGESIYDFSMSNRGIKLRAQFRLFPLKDTNNNSLFLPVCRIRYEVYGIRMRNTGGSCFVRQDAYKLFSLGPRPEKISFDSYLFTQIPPSNTGSEQTKDSIVMKSRDRVLEIVLPHSMKVLGRWPLEQWDEEDAVFFGPTRSSEDLGWASLAVAAWPNPRFCARTTIGFYFYALGWASDPRRDSPPRCTVHRTPTMGDDQALEDLNREMVEKSLDASLVANGLLNHGVSEQSFLEAGKTEQEVLLIAYDVIYVKKENANKCLNSFWRVSFSWQVVRSDQVPDTQGRDWMGIREEPSVWDLSSSLGGIKSCQDTG